MEDGDRQGGAGMEAQEGSTARGSRLRGEGPRQECDSPATCGVRQDTLAVSYTHLTLPTICSV
eukprot:14172800-Alexandrium_andersonii.AAC.1